MASGSDKKGRVVGAESSRKLLQLLLMFTPSRPTWAVAELAEQLGITQSMAYRYVALLREVGLIDAAGGKTYRVTDLVRSLALAAGAARVPLGDISLPVLERIRDAGRETTFVTRRSGWFTYVLEREQTPHPVRLIFERGQAIALHQGSSSRILLSAMSHSERQAYFDQFGIDRSKVGRGLLTDSALDELAQSGVTESFEETGEGIWSVSAAIREDGNLIGALGIAAPLFRVNAQQRNQLHDLAVEGAAEISARMNTGIPAAQLA